MKKKKHFKIYLYIFLLWTHSVFLNSMVRNRAITFCSDFYLFPFHRNAMIGTNKLQSHRGEQTNVYFQMFTADHFEKIFGAGFFVSAHVPLQEMQILMTPIGPSSLSICDCRVTFTSIDLKKRPLSWGLQIDILVLDLSQVRIFV